MHVRSLVKKMFRLSVRNLLLYGTWVCSWGGETINIIPWQPHIAHKACPLVLEVVQSHTTCFALKSPPITTSPGEASTLPSSKHFLHPAAMVTPVYWKLVFVCASCSCRREQLCLYATICSPHSRVPLAVSFVNLEPRESKVDTVHKSCVRQ